MLAALAACTAGGCGGRTPSGGPADESGRPTAEPAPEPELVRSLCELGDRALEGGREDAARERFERALDAFSDSRCARLGLARLARVRGRPEEARRRLAALLEREPGHVGALVALAEVRAGQGATGEAVELLDRARRRAPQRPEPHAALARLTGPAPEAPGAGLEALVRRAGRHPYDPAAAHAAGAALAAAGRDEQAARWLRGAWWLGDLDPGAALASVELLRRIDADWEGRRVVPVHVYADAGVRADPWWSMRLRLLFANLSRALHPLLGTVFVPVSMQGFVGADAGATLAEVRRAWAAEHPRPPPSGMLALFTAHPPPAGPGRRLGEAGFLDRWLVVRLERGPSTGSRTLVHEILHLYGAVHITPTRDALMNPSGDSLQLDEGNSRIAWLLRDRRFGPGGLQPNVLEHVDAGELAAAYAAVLGGNLDARRDGLAEALASARESRFLGARQAREATELDSHLGDVADFVGRLLAHDGRRVEAAAWLENAARLYGPGTRRGRAARALAERLVPPPDAGSP